MAIIRQEGDRFYAPRAITKLRVGDELIVEGDPAVWEPLCDGVRLESLHEDNKGTKPLRSEDVVLANAVVMPNSKLEGHSVRGIRLHDNYGINLLALSPAARATTLALEECRVRGWRSAAFAG